MEIPEPCVTDADGGTNERIRLFHLANRLAVAFWVWAIVVGLVGTALLLYARSIHDDQLKNEREHVQMELDHNQMENEIAELRLYTLTTRERQNNVIDRVRELEKK